MGLKRLLWIVVALLLLTGCAAGDVFEVISDENVAPVLAKQMYLKISLPEEAALASMEAMDGSKLYLCDGYTVTTQKLPGGDLDRTLRETTGFGADSLLVMQTRQADWKRYECVWSAAGEWEDQVGRAVILDDGSDHHIVTVMAGYTQAGDLQSTWQHIMESATLVSTEQGSAGTAPGTVGQLIPGTGS